MPRIKNVRKRLSKIFADEYIVVYDDDVEGGVLFLSPNVVEDGVRIAKNEKLRSLLPKDWETYQERGRLIATEHEIGEGYQARLGMEKGLSKRLKKTIRTRDEEVEALRLGSEIHKKARDTVAKHIRLATVEIERLEKSLKSIASKNDSQYDELAGIEKMRWRQRLKMVFTGYKRRDRK